MCGEEFMCLDHVVNHQTRREDHINRTAVVTTFHRNRTLESETRPTLLPEIGLFYCGAYLCQGTPAQSYKVNQFISKCTVCSFYKCLLCVKTHRNRCRLERHLITDYQPPADPRKLVHGSLMQRHLAIRRLKCRRCYRLGTAVRKDGYYCTLYCMICNTELAKTDT
ncbi:hypothetical protein EB796_013575 [Bugula neritina]|uniref:Uncharacterized protein n=1 Tax=Bugula neritina TaxID=10212 RepID=A0A7J7JQ87_BUGNE|nr:hypothetical protein EB796_013575 [Bugula neritina]